MYAQKRKGNRIKRKPVPERKPANYWSTYQNNVFNYVAKGSGHAVVLAAPGSGKSTTIVESLFHVPNNEEVLCLAFNNSVAAELTLRVPLGTKARTFHRLGLESVRNNWGEMYDLKGRNSIDKDDLASHLLASKIVGTSDKSLNLREAIVWAVKMSKTMLCDTEQQIESVCCEFGIPNCGIMNSDFSSIVKKILDESKKEPITVNNRKVISFDDMLWLPYVKGWVPHQYDRVFVDEAQDLSASRVNLVLKSLKPGGKLYSVGDRHQCVHEDTLISTPSGKVKVTELKVGDKVLSWRNNSIVEQVIKHKEKSIWKYGVKIKTKSGKSLSMSRTHKIWASDFILKGEQHIVYLMYRYDMGYRIGVTNKFKDTARLGRRAVSEKADKLWILKVCEDRNSALYYEKKWSLKHSIPACVFEGESRGLNQDKINNIFSEFGSGGIGVLDELHLHFDLPHWMARSTSGAKKQRAIIKLVAHGSKNNTVIFEWENDLLNVKDAIEKAGITVNPAKDSANETNRFRVRKYFPSYRDALYCAERIKSIVPNSFISEKLHTSDGCISLITAGGLHIGASVAAQKGEKVVLDEIISISHCEGDFYDLDVDDASNFFGGDILSHNCIYGFAGADSKVIDTMVNDIGAVELPLSVSYRCPRKVVELASDINPSIKAADNAIDGQIKHLVAEELHKHIVPGNSAILSRTNYALISCAFQLLKLGIRASIIGKDIGNRFIWRIDNWMPSTVKDLKQSVMHWRDEMCEYNSASNRARIYDEAESILRFTRNANNVAEVKFLIREFFTESHNDHVKLSTVHKAKGLEWDHVYMLEKTFKPGKSEEENNIYYVGITRAKKSLTFVR